MKQLLRSKVAKASSYIEIYISALILIGIILFSFTIVKEIIDVIKGYMNVSANFDVEGFISHSLQLIIGIEFVKMLSKHTPGSAVEVLLFAIARKLITSHSSSMLDFLLGILGIAVLFFIRKYLSTSGKDQKIE